MELNLSKTFLYRISPGDTLANICTRFNTDKSNIIRNNPSLDLYVGEMVEIKVNDYIAHLVKPTETLASIAKIYDTTVQKIVNDNNLNESRLYIGQLIKIYDK